MRVLSFVKLTSLSSVSISSITYYYIYVIQYLYIIYPIKFILVRLDKLTKQTLFPLHTHFPLDTFARVQGVSLNFMENRKIPIKNRNFPTNN